jgi:hypothetical protein
MSHAPRSLEIGLTAAIIVVEKNQPMVLASTQGIDKADKDPRQQLPSGPFHPLTHGTFERGLRAWVSEQTGLSLGYVEQLYTFGDRGRNASAQDEGPHVVSVGYVALTRRTISEAHNTFTPWYRHFPWEDWRRGRPQTLLDQHLIPALLQWTQRPEAHSAERALPRATRVQLAFALEGRAWDEEKVLERYELLYEAGLVEEAQRDGRPEAAPLPSSLSGYAMRDDHRRILATAMGRLRGKLKYRPVVFELMPPTFTLTSLQQTIEALSGLALHKQNFRRLVENAALVEPTGEHLARTGGRPAALYRFRREVITERPAPGVRLSPRA